MEGIDLSKYLKNIPEYITGRNRYNPVDMLKTVLFAFADNGYCSLRKLEDNCKVNIRYMYLMNWKTPSYRTFGYFVNEVLAESIEAIFQDVNLAIFTQEKVDLSHLYIDGTKLEANANKYSWVWKKATEKSRYRLFAKITALLDEINEELRWNGLRDGGIDVTVGVYFLLIKPVAYLARGWKIGIAYPDFGFHRAAILRQSGSGQHGEQHTQRQQDTEQAFLHRLVPPFTPFASFYIGAGYIFSQGQHRPCRTQPL